MNDVTSCGNCVQGIKAHISFPDTLKSYTSLWLSYTAIVNWFAHQLVEMCSTNLYINMVGSNMFYQTYIQLMCEIWEEILKFI